MKNKNLSVLIAALLLAFTLVFFLVQVRGIPLKEVIAGIFVYILYGVLLVSYLLRFAFILLGVFAFYRLLQEAYAKQVTV